MLDGTAWDVQFEVQNCKYSDAYYLSNGIYPSWLTLIKAKGMNQDPPSQNFQKLQEAAQKDIKCAFGALQGKWLIVSVPVRLWSPEDMVIIMKTCVILHNMSVENHDSKSNNLFQLPQNITLVTPQSQPYSLQQKQIRKIEIKSGLQHQRLLKDSIEMN